MLYGRAIWRIRCALNLLIYEGADPSEPERSQASESLGETSACCRRTDMAVPSRERDVDSRTGGPVRCVAERPADVEEGRRGLLYERLGDIAKALDVPMSELLVDIE